MPAFAGMANLISIVIPDFVVSVSTELDERLSRTMAGMPESQDVQIVLHPNPKPATQNLNLTNSI